ncbi:MAG: NAD(P)H-dependent oxidoreductase [Candidatus Wallbacteria bacterium]|nr:NAD(P)H-dependent oxidoreductase [Candidatus Wallbacteria bacterium]
MHILGICGSMRKDRHTNLLLQRVIDGVSSRIDDCTSEIIQLADLNVGPCRVVCKNYCKTHPYQCCMPDDAMKVLDRIASANALVMGAPLYFRGPPAGFQALIERLIAVFFALEEEGARRNEDRFKGKPCGLVGVAEYSNPLSVLEYLHDFACLLGLHTVKVSRLPYLGVAGQGDVTKDMVFNPLERCDELALGLRAELQRGVLDGMRMKIDPQKKNRQP